MLYPFCITLKDTFNFLEVWISWIFAKLARSQNITPASEAIFTLDVQLTS